MGSTFRSPYNSSIQDFSGNQLGYKCVGVNSPFDLTLKYFLPNIEGKVVQFSDGQCNCNVLCLTNKEVLTPSSYVPKQSNYETGLSGGPVFSKVGQCGGR